MTFSLRKRRGLSETRVERLILLLPSKVFFTLIKRAEIVKQNFPYAANIRGDPVRAAAGALPGAAYSFKRHTQTLPSLIPQSWKDLQIWEIQTHFCLTHFTFSFYSFGGLYCTTSNPSNKKEAYHESDTLLRFRIVWSRAPTT